MLQSVDGYFTSVLATSAVHVRLIYFRFIPGNLCVLKSCVFCTTCVYVFNGSFLRACVWICFRNCRQPKKLLFVRPVIYIFSFLTNVVTAVIGAVSHAKSERYFFIPMHGELCLCHIRQCNVDCPKLQVGVVH